MRCETRINGRVVSQGEIDAWERRRIAVVARKLGVPLDVGSPDLDALSSQLALYKRRLGYGQIMRRIGSGLKISASFAALLNSLSFGRRRFSVIEIVVGGISAAQAVQGMESLMLVQEEEHEIVNLGACPDHYALRPHGGSRIEVVETTGGSPLPIRFFIDLDSKEGVTIPRDASYPFQFAGAAMVGKGTVIGGIRHQFRDEGNGFRARLAVEFPLVVPDYFICQHQWHLACEFGRWFRWIYQHKRKSVDA